MTADFSPEKIINAIKDKAIFGEKCPVIIEKSSHIAYSYICDAFDKLQEDMGDIGRRNEYLRKRDKFINDADETFTKNFNLFAEQIKIFPEFDLPVKDWSVVELMAKLHLMLYEDRPGDHKYNLEFFTRLGDEFNRIKALFERLKCDKCDKYMCAVKGLSTWKTITNIRRTAYGDHFEIFATTTFSCRNDACSEKCKLVYLSYCRHCGEIIDSRCNHVCIKRFYLCNKFSARKNVSQRRLFNPCKLRAGYRPKYKKAPQRRRWRFFQSQHSI